MFWPINNGRNCWLNSFVHSLRYCVPLGMAILKTRFPENSIGVSMQILLKSYIKKDIETYKKISNQLESKMGDDMQDPHEAFVFICSLTNEQSSLGKEVSFQFTRDQTTDARWQIEVPSNQPLEKNLPNIGYRYFEQVHQHRISCMQNHNLPSILIVLKIFTHENRQNETQRPYDIDTGKVPPLKFTTANITYVLSSWLACMHGHYVCIVPMQEGRCLLLNDMTRGPEFVSNINGWTPHLIFYKKLIKNLMD